MWDFQNVKSAPGDAFVALASQPGYFLHPLEIFIFNLIIAGDISFILHREYGKEF
jgi:hypothetical protein